MFINFWIIWSLVGLVIATLLFAWSVKTRQFSNSRRAALIPFDDVKPEKDDEQKSGKNRVLFWSVMFLFGLSLLMLIGTIALIIR